MKLIGVIFLLLAGAGYGCAAAHRLDQNAGQLRLLRLLTTEMMSELRCNLPLISELLCQTASQPAFRDLQFLQRAAADADAFPQCWQRALQQDTVLPREARAVMATVGETLGSTTLEGQLSTLALCSERLSALQHDAEKLAAEKGKLYRSLGFFGALFLSILLL